MCICVYVSRDAFVTLLVILSIEELAYQVLGNPKKGKKTFASMLDAMLLVLELKHLLSILSSVFLTSSTVGSISILPSFLH